MKQIANSMREFGFINPIIINKDQVIVAGHGRFQAAKLLGFAEVPTIVVNHLTDAQVRAYRLADNQLALNSGYDNDLLKVELGELAGLDLDFDLEITGFETAEIDIRRRGKFLAVPQVVIERFSDPRKIFNRVLRLMK